MPLKPELSSEHIMRLGRRVIETERDGLNRVLDLLDTAFETAVATIIQSQGRIAVTGMGKAGLIGAKIAATFSSTGTPAYVLHPADAIHGDVGMICAGDVVLALSNSGESDELDRIIPLVRQFGCTVLLITGRPHSRCATQSNVVLNIGKQDEACPLGMAPSSSTTAMLALGDALALTVSELKGFATENYAALHPGGALGRSLMLVDDLMRTGNDCPVVLETDTVQDYNNAVMAAPRRAGAAAIVKTTGQLVGFFTDGDLRRLVGKTDQPGTYRLGAAMTTEPKTVMHGDRVSHALELMRRYQIDELPVVDAHHNVVGMVDIQDLLAAGFSLFDAG